MKILDYLKNRWRLRMFKGITIELAGPICRCKERNLSWCPTRNSAGGHELHIVCKDCETKLIVGHEQFTAGWKLDVDYPNGRSKEKEDAKILKLVPPSSAASNQES